MVTKIVLFEHSSKFLTYALTYETLLCSAEDSQTGLKWHEAEEMMTEF